MSWYLTGIKKSINYDFSILTNKKIYTYETLINENNYPNYTYTIDISSSNYKILYDNYDIEVKNNIKPGIWIYTEIIYSIQTTNFNDISKSVISNVIQKIIMAMVRNCR